MNQIVLLKVAFWLSGFLAGALIMFIVTASLYHPLYYMILPSKEGLTCWLGHTYNTYQNLTQINCTAIP